LNGFQNNEQKQEKTDGTNFFILKQTEVLKNISGSSGKKKWVVTLATKGFYRPVSGDVWTNKNKRWK
jgi:hypothetical protein